MNKTFSVFRRRQLFLRLLTHIFKLCFSSKTFPIHTEKEVQRSETGSITWSKRLSNSEATFSNNWNLG